MLRRKSWPSHCPGPTKPLRQKELFRKESKAVSNTIQEFVIMLNHADADADIDAIITITLTSTL